MRNFMLRCSTAGACSAPFTAGPQFKLCKFSWSSGSSAIAHESRGGSPPARPVPRLLAVGDLHGDMEQALRILRALGAIDEERNWAAGTSTLVQLGDIVDRGHDSLPLLDLFEQLREQARGVGGEVVTLLGNHELMLLQQDLRYFSKTELRRMAKDAGKGDSVAEGLQQLQQLLSPEGAYGQLLRTRPVAYISRMQPHDLQRPRAAEAAGSSQPPRPGPCDILFVHAAALPEMLQLSAARLAAAGGSGLQGELDSPAATDAAQAATADASAAVSTDGVEPGTVHRDWALHNDTGRLHVGVWNAAVGAALSNCSSRSCSSKQHDALAAMLLGGEGAVWSRLYARGSKAVVCAKVTEIVHMLAVSRIVIGHTVQDGGKITSACGGRLLLIDVGMSRQIDGEAVAGLQCTLQEVGSTADLATGGRATGTEHLTSKAADDAGAVSAGGAASHAADAVAAAQGQQQAKAWEMLHGEADRVHALHTRAGVPGFTGMLVVHYGDPLHLHVLPPPGELEMP